MRRRVGGEQDTILIFVEELPRCHRLASEFTNAGCHIDRHIWKTVQVVGDILQIFGEVAKV